MLAFVLAFPGAAALSLPPPDLVLDPEGAALADPPKGCRAENGTFACSFFVNTTDAPARQSYGWPIPAFPETLATITVALQGMDNGWQVSLVRKETFTVMGKEYESTQTVSKASHRANTTRGVSLREATTHVFLGPRIKDGVPSGSMTLLFSPDDPQNDPTSVGSFTPASAGQFQIFYLAEPVPPGTPPARPAATADFPQMPGTPHDGARPEVDLIAAWLDDPSEGDGLFDAHVRVAGDLMDMDWNRSQSPTVAGLPGPQVKHSGAQYEIHFKVQGAQYYLQLTRYPTKRGDAWMQSSHDCGLYRAAADANDPDPLLSVPRCRYTNDTISWSVPERSIGSPGPGVPFEELSVNVDDLVYGTGRDQQDAQPRDSAIARFPFALGGPAVWDDLNGCAFCPVEPAWYEPAYLESHLADVVQIVGAAIAVVTFFIGLLIVRRRRAQTKRLLDEVARVEQEHESDTRAALIALGKLDTRFARLFHQHTINDAQYQVLAQRVATAATRFALRQGLGLDDGAAGDGRAPADAPSTPGDRAPPRRVPVVDADADAARGKEASP